MPSDHAPTRPLTTSGGTGTRPLPATPPVPPPAPGAAAPSPQPAPAPYPPAPYPPAPYPPAPAGQAYAAPYAPGPAGTVGPGGPARSAGGPAAAPRPAPARPGARPDGDGPSVASRVVAAIVAVLAVAGGWLVWRFFVDTYAGQMLERAAFDGAVTGQGELWTVAEPVLDTVSIAFVVGGLGAAMGIALLRRRWGLAVQVAFLVVGANVTTQLVKHSLLGREELIGGWHWENSLPSGHTTVAGSVAAALLLVVPRGARALVAVLGGAYTAATGVSTLVGQWHRPSDVVAAVLVVLAWAALVCAFTPRSALDPGAGPTPGSTVVAVLLLLGAAAAGVAAGLALRATPATWGTTTAQDVTAYAGGVAGVLAVTAAAFAVLLLVRQATGRPDARAVRG
ncbi:PAP2 superfamily protein [Cellulosimicrobium cellulans J34]|nr:PAP2 superfamily protein [Cellulosimicrobium cellulans J34]SME91455.1 PAP2 superfamily protein [Cellulosimicrobium cellulans J1]